MEEKENKITYFAETGFRNQKTKFGIKEKDRTRHMYIIGKTGMGKSTMLENLAIQDIQNGEGIIFIDPHGSAASKLLEYVPKHRIQDVIYFNPSDTDFPIAFNVLEDVPKNKKNSVASGLMNAFKKIWVDAWSSRMEYLLNYSLLALLDVPETTLLSVNKLLSDKDYRKSILEKVEDTVVKSFWEGEFTKYNDKYATEAVAPIQNKIGQFISNPIMRNIIGQEDSSIDFRKAMDEKKIVIINLSKGSIGPENMRLLGGMLITKIFLAAISRADLNPEELKRMPTCHLYVDEFQNFANVSFAEILSESRKYKLALTVANQYIEQMTDEVKSAIFGNVGTLVSFRVGPTDAEFLEKEFAPVFVAEDLVNLGFTQNYLKLMIDGIGSKPFSSNSLAPISPQTENFVSEIIDFSRKSYAKNIEIVEEKIHTWNTTSFAAKKDNFKEEKKFSKKDEFIKQETPKDEVFKKEETEKVRIIKQEVSSKQVQNPPENSVKKVFAPKQNIPEKQSFSDAIKKAIEKNSQEEVLQLKQNIQNKNNFSKKQEITDLILKEKTYNPLPEFRISAKSKVLAQNLNSSSSNNSFSQVQKRFKQEEKEEGEDDVLKALLEEDFEDKF